MLHKSEQMMAEDFKEKLCQLVGLDSKKVSLVEITVGDDLIPQCFYAPITDAKTDVPQHQKVEVSGSGQEAKPTGLERFQAIKNRG